MACRSLSNTTSRYFTLSIRSSRPTQWISKPFTTSRPKSAEEPPRASSSTDATRRPPTSPTKQTTKTAPSSIEYLQSAISNLSQPKPRNDYGLLGSKSLVEKYGAQEKNLERYGDDEWHLHVYSHRNNTHLTLCGEDRKSIISISAGNLGFRKAQRGTYDAGYQLMAYLISRIQQQGLMGKIRKLELTLRGFGQGREAVVKVLMGIEGTRLRDQIVRVVEKTRLKIGGTRSRAPRRLG